MFAIFAQKPLLGAAAGFGGLFSAILTFIGVLTPIIGFIAAIFGAMAAYHSWRNARRTDIEAEAKK